MVQVIVNLIGVLVMYSLGNFGIDIVIGIGVNEFC